MNFIANRSKGSGDIEETQNCWVDFMTLKFDLDLILSEVKWTLFKRAHLNCFVQTQHIEISLFERIMNGRTQQPFIFYI